MLPLSDMIKSILASKINSSEKITPRGVSLVFFRGGGGWQQTLEKKGGENTFSPEIGGHEWGVHENIFYFWRRGGGEGQEIYLKDWEKGVHR